MKKIKRTVIIALATTFVGAFTLGLTSCVKEEEVTSKVNGAVNPVKTEISTINGYIDELEEKAQGLETKLTAVNTAIAETDGELDEVTKILDDTKTLLEGEIAEIKTEIKALKAEDSEILTAISTITGKIQTLESNIEKLNGNVTALAERVSKNETDIADVLERLETLEKENAIMKACLNGDHETEISYVWSETACTATLGCEHCSYALDEEGTIYDLGGYKEATFENEGLEKQTFGDIQKAVIDATELSAEEIGETVSYVLSLGGRNIHTVLKAEPSHAELYAIRRAIVDDKTVVNSSVNLTLAGAVSFPDCLNGDVQQTAFGRVSVGEVYEYVEELACLTLPDATHVGEYVFYGSNVSSLVAPKLQSVGEHAFSRTALTVVDLPNLTTIGAFGLSASQIKTIKLPSVTVLEKNVFWSPSNLERVELTAQGEITVGEDAFDPACTHKADLILHVNRRTQVEGNTWMPLDADGNEFSFTFKSITFVGAFHDTTTNTYYVDSVRGLQEWNEAAKEDVTANLVLEKDIVLTGENNFQPIGSYENNYTGTFDGAGHSITGLHIKDVSTVGLIAYLGEGGVVKNLTLVDATLKAEGAEHSSAAAIVFRNCGIVQNCHVTGNSVVSAEGGRSYAGGVVYTNSDQGSITGCTNEATVSAVGAGGIVAQIYGGSVENCVNKGTVEGYYSVGGITGYLTNGATVIACSNTTAVTGSSRVGGIVGQTSNDSIVIACFNAGTVSGDYNVGGIVGDQAIVGADNVIGSWTVDTQEATYQTDVTENKNGVGNEGSGELTTAYLGDATAINAVVATMNGAIESALGNKDYQWVAGENGAYPTLRRMVDVTIALKEAAQTTVYYKDNLTVDLSTLLDITEGAGEVTYTLITATGSIEGSVLSCPLQETYTVKVTVAQTATHKSAEYTFTITVTQDPATGDFDGEWVTL